MGQQIRDHEKRIAELEHKIESLTDSVGGLIAQLHGQSVTLGSALEEIERLDREKAGKPGRRRRDNVPEVPTVSVEVVTEPEAADAET